MVKIEDITTILDKDKYGGRSDKGISWEEFDQQTFSKVRSMFGDKYGRLLWRNELLCLLKLDISDDASVDYYKFMEHCELVYEVISRGDNKHAEILYDGDRFWTVKWQIGQRNRFGEKLFVYLEKVLMGEASRQLRSVGVDRVGGIREHLFERFGGGHCVELRRREARYYLGMPKSVGAPAFPDRVNMVDKLDQLETEREWFIKVCPADQLDTFEPAQESRLVRIILELIPIEYDTAVEEAKTQVRLEKYMAGDKSAGVVNVRNIRNENFSADWLPKYEGLRACLINRYFKYVQRWGKPGIQNSKPLKIPTMITADGSQPGLSNITCYGCGQRGHIRGSADCKAGANAVWSGAPEG